jgi:tellurite methyltransferase
VEDSRRKWDAIYSQDQGVPSNPSRVLEENAHLLPRGGDALEIACGKAGNAVMLARAGFRTRAWDISPVVVAQINDYAREHGLPLEAEARDMTKSRPEPGSCDVIVVAHYLERSLVPAIIDALRPGGLVFYQTFTRTKVSCKGPSNPDFLLADGELRELFADLELLVYREERTAGDTARGLRDEAMLVARKRG